jgi:hypothetical protein
VRFAARVGPVRETLEVPDESPFAELRLGPPRLSLRWSELSFTAKAPTIAGHLRRRLAVARQAAG